MTKFEEEKAALCREIDKAGDNFEFDSVSLKRAVLSAFDLGAKAGQRSMNDKCVEAVVKLEQRVKELEKDLIMQKDLNKQKSRLLNDSEAKVETYREALEKIAKSTAKYSGMTIAQQALKEERD